MTVLTTGTDFQAVRAALAKHGGALDRQSEQAWERGESDYAARLGLSSEHVPALIEVAKLWVDKAYWEEWDDKPDDDPAVYAPVYAWRALTELKAADAVEPLVAMIRPMAAKMDDWLTEEFDDVIARFGEAGIEPLRKLFFEINPSEPNNSKPNHDDTGEWTRVAACSGLQKIAERYPEHRDRVVGVLTEKISRPKDDTPMVVGYVISDLIELKADESAAVIEHAFDARAVDPMVAGHWPEVKKELGLATAEQPARRLDAPHAVEKRAYKRIQTDRNKKKQQRKNRKRSRR